MNPVKLKFRHGGEMLVSPIGLRFVEDPDHGPLVLIPEFGQPRGYQLDMTLEEAHAAMGIALGAPLGDVIAELKTHAFGIAAEVRDLRPAVEMHETRLNLLARQPSRIDAQHRLHTRNIDRWEALAIHLGLPEGWEHLHEGAAEVKGALVSQAEEIDTLRKEAKENWDLRAKLTAELRDLIMERVERLEQGMIDRVGVLERLTGCLCTYGMTERKANEIDSVKAHVDALYSELGLNSRWEGEKLVSYRDTDSILTEVVLMQREVSRLTEEASLFTVAERVGELEEARTNQRRRFDEYQEASDKMFAALRSTTTRLRDDYNRLDYSLVDLARWCGSLEQRNSAAPFKPEDSDTVFPQLDDRTCVQRQATGPIEITWTQAGPCNATTGQPIECSSWRAPEKPKSAWKPLRECYVYGRILIRKDVTLASVSATKTESGIHLDFFPAGWFPNEDQSEYSFCPIPE